MSKSSAATIAAVEKRNLALGKGLAKVCDERRAADIMVLDVRKICDFADVFLIATASSGPQIKGIAREVERFMAEEKVSLYARSGVSEGKWVVLDYGDIVVHIFNEAERIFYQLEDLWADAKELRW
ncbi:MAG: ribosome silencing factor [Planctomycetes bacterium]|nr:ribosome silencing factor [Planctomycetota bacterium]